jgi:hypothetical protein
VHWQQEAKQEQKVQTLKQKQKEKQEAKKREELNDYLRHIRIVKEVQCETASSARGQRMLVQSRPTEWEEYAHGMDDDTDDTDYSED